MHRRPVVAGLTPMNRSATKPAHDPNPPLSMIQFENIVKGAYISVVWRDEETC
jgi:hypothetical protein